MIGESSANEKDNASENYAGFYIPVCLRTLDARKYQAS